MFRPTIRSGVVPGVVSVVLLALVLGMLAAGAFRVPDQNRVRIENQARERKLAVEVKEKEALSGWIVAGKVVLGTIGLGGLALGFMVLGAYGIRKALTIGPDKRGLFPLVVGRNAGAWEVRDPNRALSGVTTMGRDPSLPPGLEREQVQVTGQAQAVQLAVAIASGDVDKNKAGPEITQQLTAKPMPQVETSPWEPSHIERLLVESGALEGDYENAE